MSLLGNLGATWASPRAWTSPASAGVGTLTEISGVVVCGAVEAEALQVGDEVGHDALEDALALAQDVELQNKVRMWQDTSHQPKCLQPTPPMASLLGLGARGSLSQPKPCRTSRRAWRWAGGWCR